MLDEKLIYTLIGKRIKDKRNAAGKLQAKLAESIGVSRASLANYESGNTAIYISDLYLIADQLGKDINEFLPSVEEIKSASSPEKRLDKLENSKKKEILDFIDTLNKREGENG